MDQLELNKEMKVKDLINLLRARSFGNKGFAYYKLGDKKVHLNLRLSDSPNFD
jgi:methionyl-tRNA formyltransferase